MSHSLHRTQLIVRPLAEVFAFFADAGNLEAITPAFLNFQIVTARPIDMRPGTLIDYRLRLFGIGFSWRTLIESYDPPHRFTDVQLQGPYRRWHHTHTFVSTTEGTQMLDLVEYELPLGYFGRLANLLFVGQMLNRIFDYRAQKIAELLPDHKLLTANGYE